MRLLDAGEKASGIYAAKRVGKRGEASLPSGRGSMQAQCKTKVGMTDAADKLQKQGSVARRVGDGYPRQE
jgi:hypothetical protein